MATQPITGKVLPDDPFANGPSMAALEIAGVKPFTDPESEAQVALGEVYALLALMSASFDTSQQLRLTGHRETELGLFNDGLQARALDGLGRLVSLALHLINVAEAARAKGVAA